MDASFLGTAIRKLSNPSSRESVEMDTFVVLGGGGHAKVLVAVLKRLGHVVIGYSDLQDCGAILGVPYLGDDEALWKAVREGLRSNAAIGVGKVDLSEARVRLASDVLSQGLELPVIVSPRATVNEEVRLGDAVVVFDGAVMNSGTVADRLCIFNTNSTIEHDCRIGENVHVAPGAIVSGGVTIGPNCLIGAGATLVHGITICAHCLIGAGSTVIDDLVVPGTYAGNPARRIR